MKEVLGTVAVATMFVWLTSAQALEQQFAADLAKAMAEECRKEVQKANPEQNKAQTRDYCACYGREVSANVTEADLLLLLAGQTTDDFNRITEEAAVGCMQEMALKSAEDLRKSAKYDDLPDINMKGMGRTKSGVFTVKPRPEQSIDSEAMFLVKVEKMVCGYVSSPMGNYSVRETLDALRVQSPSMAKAIMQTPEARITNFEEIKVRNNPAVIFEMRGKRETDGAVTEMVMLMTAVLETPKRANVIGLCMTEAAHFDKSKRTMRKLSMGATSSRIYKR